MSQPATREDVERLGERLQVLVGVIETATREQTRVLSTLAQAASPSNGPVQTVTLPTALPPPSRTERAAWVAAFCAALALVVTVMQGQRIGDVGNHMQTERIERRLFESWVTSEINTLRTFTKTGVLAPMQPKPKPAEQVKP